LDIPKQVILHDHLFNGKKNRHEMRMEFWVVLQKVIFPNKPEKQKSSDIQRRMGGKGNYDFIALFFYSLNIMDKWGMGKF
jgi:hypothetical protein